MIKDKKYDICVFGGVALDQTYYQHEDGKYSDKPDALFFGGKGANQAIAASRAGAKVIFISKIGKDELENKILDNLRYNGVDTAGIEIEEGLENDYSDIYVNVVDKGNDIVRHGKAIDSFTPAMIENNKDFILNSTYVVCQLKCPIEVTETLLNFCQKHNKRVIMTPCRPKKLIGRLDLLDKVSYITCNAEECKTIFETDDIESCVKKYPNKLIVTLGSEGLIYYNGSRLVHMPAIKTEVLDTVGAGDTLAGNLAYSLSQGMDLKHALRRSMYASTMKIQVKSAQAGMPYKEELDEFIQRHRNKNFEYEKELNFAIRLVKEVYFRIRSNKNFEIKLKDDNTIVTDVDVKTEQYLVEKISEKFQGDKFLSEETNPNGYLSDRTWIIDPIDGTTQFINGGDEWGIQLAFYDKGSTKFSIIYLPKKDELFYSCEGNGSYLNNNKIIIEDSDKPINQCILEFGGSIEKHLDTKIRIFKRLHDEDKRLISEFRYTNVCCISFTNLAKNFTSGLILTTKKPWDIMPGLLLCKECGIDIYPMDWNNDITLLTSDQNLKGLVFGPRIHL